MKKITHAKHGLVTMLGSIVNLAIRLIRIKLLALFFGPIGFGQIGLLTNFIELMGTIVSAGYSGTLNRELPRQKTDVDRKAVISTTVFLLLINTAILIIPAISIFYWLSSEFLFDWFTNIILSIALLSAIGSRYLMGFFQGLLLSRKFFIMTVASAVINLILVIILIYFKADNILYFVLAGPAITMMFSMVSIGRYIIDNFDFFLIDKSRVKQILRMAGPITLTTMMVPLTLYYLRSFTEVNLSAEALGFIQPGLQLVALLAMVSSSFAAMTIIRWDQSAEEGYSRNQMTLLGVSIVLPIVAIPILFITQDIQRWGITILFSHEFLPALVTIPWFLSAEVLRISGFILNQTFISKGYNWFTLIPRFACSFVIVALLHSQFGLSILAISQAYFYGHIVFLAVSILTFLWVQHNGRTKNVKNVAA